MSWLTALRFVLLALLVMLLAGTAFVAGSIAGKKTRPVAAGPFVEEVPAERRKNARDFVEAALASRFAGRNQEAVRHLEEARRQDPGLRGVDYQLALTHLELRDYDAARAAARRSLDRNEETSNAHAVVALIAMESAREGGGAAGAAGDEVLASVQSAREADPLNPMPFYVLAEFYRATDRPEMAVPAYQRALERVSKTDSVMVATVKAGLAGLRLHYEPGAPPLKLQDINGIYPPEQLFFGAADALLRGDRETADGYLQEARTRLPGALYEALLQDSFFQDYLSVDTLYDPQAETPQP